MKQYKLLILALAATMILGTASPILAKHARGPHGLHALNLASLIEDLNLSDEQKAQVEAIVAKYEDDKNSLLENVRPARDELRDVIFAEAYNEAAVRQAAQQVSSIMEELAVLHAKMVAELRTVLSPEQIGYLKGRLEGMMGLGRDRRPMGGR